MIQIDARLGDMNDNITRLGADMNARFAGVDARFASVEARLTGLEGKIDGLRTILIVASAGIIGTLAAAIIAFILRGP